MKLVIRQSSGDQFEVEVNENSNVLELKQACVEAGKLPVDQQRLIFKGNFNLINFLLGRILKDEQTLESYKIEAGLTVHLVRAKATSSDTPSTSSTSEQPLAQPSAPLTGLPPGMGFPGGMGGMGGFPGGMGGMGGFPGMGGMGGMPGMGGMGGMGGGMPSASQM